MLTRIDSYELTEWAAYLQLENKEREKEQKRAESASTPSRNKSNTPDIPPTFR